MAWQLKNRNRQCKDTVNVGIQQDMETPELYFSIARERSQNLLRTNHLKH